MNSRCSGRHLRGRWIFLPAALLFAVQVGATQAPAPPAAPLAPLEFLADSCFMGTFADGKTRDLVCYSWVFDRKFLRSRHRVIGGEGPYAGETLFAHNQATGTLEFAYYNSAGGIIRGEIVPTGDGLLFPSEKVQMQGAPAELRSIWRRTRNGYTAVTEKLDNGSWRPFMTIDFVRSGPASQWTEK